MKELKSVVFRIPFFPSFKIWISLICKFFKNFFYFIYFWLHCVFTVAQGALCCCVQTLSWGTPASRCGGFSCCGAQTLGACSVVVTQLQTQLPCANGILIPGPGIEPVPRALSGRFLSIESPGKSLICEFLILVLNIPSR